MWIDYQTYMRSPEWTERRNKVKDRCGGKCERCNKRKMTHVHRLTNERFGRELLTDLEGVCLACLKEAHPNRTFKKDWVLITELCKRLNVRLGAVKDVLRKEGLIEWVSISYGWRGREKGYVERKREIPTSDAMNSIGITRYKPSKNGRGTGSKGPYLWDFDRVKTLLQKHRVIR